MMSDLSPNPSPPLPNKMEDAAIGTSLEMNYNSEASVGDKRKREGKVRSIVWDHFTKVIKEDGTCDKCQCNHCQKLFTCSSRSGTTHLLRHITDGICPVFNKDKKDLAVSNYMRGSTQRRNAALPWKFAESSTPPQQYMDVEVEPLPERASDLGHRTFKTIEEFYGIRPSLSHEKLPQQPASKPHPKGEAWMNEFKNCVATLVKLTDGRIPVGSLQGNAPDYSISAAVKCLNEMEDIPQSSEMYLDAFEILQDAEERECFICLPTEPRRRWLQRTLHRRYPLRYSSSCD